MLTSPLGGVTDVDGGIAIGEENALEDELLDARNPAEVVVLESVAGVVDAVLDDPVSSSWLGVALRDSVERVALSVDCPEKVASISRKRPTMSSLVGVSTPLSRLSRRRLTTSSFGSDERPERIGKLDRISVSMISPRLPTAFRVPNPDAGRH